MYRALLWLCAVASLWAAMDLTYQVKAQPAEASQRYTLRALPWGNLFYQLDCLSGQGHCSRTAFESLWQKLGWQAEDAARLEEWRTLKKRYQRSFELASPALPSALPLSFVGVNLWDRVRLASLSARSEAEWREHLMLVMKSEDAEALLSLCQAFEGRFMPWWQTTGRAVSEKGLQDFATTLKKNQLAPLIKQASRFYGTTLPADSLLAFHFIARPEGGDHNLNGEQIEHQSVIEIREQPSGNSQLDVVIHELCHYLYRRRSHAQEAGLQAQFAAQNSQQAWASYHLLNEVLATAIGNGLVNQQRLSPADFAALQQRERGFYNDPYIDPLARAVFTRVGQALAQGESLDSPVFLRDYLTQAAQLPADVIRSPIPLLRTLGLAYDGPELHAASRQLTQQLRSGAVYGAADLERARQTFAAYPQLSGVVMLTPQRVDALQNWESLGAKPWLKALKQALQKQNALIWGVDRGQGAWLAIILSPDLPTFQSLGQRLLAQPHTFNGLMPSGSERMP
ncbi:MAG: hypothetical protein ACO1RX_04120 [Candidatus Sericytochromatia bacterium]